MSTKIDLEDLERKATLVRDSRSSFELAQWNATHASDAERWRYQQLQIAANHIAANSPPVTLALIARIRELEAFARGLMHDHVRNVDETAMHALLEKGAVLP
jgi:hypothetical protein